MSRTIFQFYKLKNLKTFAYLTQTQKFIRQIFHKQNLHYQQFDKPLEEVKFELKKFRDYF